MPGKDVLDMLHSTLRMSDGGGERSASASGSRASDPRVAERAVQVCQAFREIVRAFAKAELADELIHEALSDAGLGALPVSTSELREFAEVELHHAVADALGLDAAEAVVSGLEPMLALLARADLQPNPAADVITVVTPCGYSPASGPAAIARLAIVTPDPWLALRVRVALGGTHELAHYGSLAELGEQGHLHRSVIIDCRSLEGASGLAASATAAAFASARTDVLLLFAGVSERSALRTACPSAGLIMCSMRVSPEVITHFIGAA